MVAECDLITACRLSSIVESTSPHLCTEAAGIFFVSSFKNNFAKLRTLDYVLNSDFFAQLLKRRKIVICRGCKNLLREMGQYRWAEGGSHDAPCKENDHAMDEMRYFVATVLGKKSGGFAVATVERRK